jgi:hypothetical protein
MGADSVGYHEHSVLERWDDVVANALEYVRSWERHPRYKSGERGGPPLPQGLLVP